MSARPRQQRLDGPRVESWDSALARAGTHFRRAAAESVAGLRALLDAASLGASRRPAAESETLAVIAQGLDELAKALDTNPRQAAEPLFEALQRALDEEIGRWEQRSRDDDGEARMVLRAFLTVREVLWELSSRAPGREDGEPAGNGSAEPAGSRSEPPARGSQPRDGRESYEPPRRVQRVVVES